MSSWALGLEEFLEESPPHPDQQPDDLGHSAEAAPSQSRGGDVPNVDASISGLAKHYTGLHPKLHTSKETRQIDRHPGQKIGACLAFLGHEPLSQGLG